MNPYYTDYNEYITRFFPNFKVQKLSINTGRGCPNRDGTVGEGGCIYCNNRSFTPSYCFNGMGVAEQLARGKQFFSRKYKDMCYLAYFQSYSSTYRNSSGQFALDIMEAMSVEGIVGIVVGTRPDCVDGEILEVLTSANKRMPVFVELGVESMHDKTLRLINRGHDSKISSDTIIRLYRAGLHVGVHLIAGLPGEDEEMMLNTIERICTLPVESIKLHHLQVLKNTLLSKRIEDGDISVKPFTMEEYVEFCVKVIKIVPKRIAIERFLASSPVEDVIMPKWNVKNYVFTDRLNAILSKTIPDSKCYKNKD